MSLCCAEDVVSSCLSSEVWRYQLQTGARASGWGKEQIEVNGVQLFFINAQGREITHYAEKKTNRQINLKKPQLFFLPYIY